jgi:hypothetical protein
LTCECSPTGQPAIVGSWSLVVCERVTQQTFIACRWSSTAVQVLGLEIHQRSKDEWPHIAGMRLAALKAAAIADRLNQQGSRTPGGSALDGSGDLVGDEKISTAGEVPA